MAESLLAAVRHCQSEAPLANLLAAPHVLLDVNKLGPSGVTALGLAVWRNHAGLVEALLEAGADPDVRDTESGWSALHRALHWGQLRIAAALLRANASLGLPDWRGRSPLDLLSCELREYLEPGDGDVFSWGNGSNYTLGTGSTDVQLHPARVEPLHDQRVAAVSAAKFHSAAVTLDGRLLTWGWGRGGRLGHPDAQTTSQQRGAHPPLGRAGRRRQAPHAAGHTGRGGVHHGQQPTRAAGVCGGQPADAPTRDGAACARRRGGGRQQAQRGGQRQRRCLHLGLKRAGTAGVWHQRQRVQRLTAPRGGHARQARHCGSSRQAPYSGADRQRRGVHLGTPRGVPPSRAAGGGAGRRLPARVDPRLPQGAR